MRLEWIYKKFEAITVRELYAIIQLRNEVFVVEQNCAYQDADGKDPQSYHLCGWAGDTLVAYCRILPPMIAYPECSIGRVVSSSQLRRAGAGRELMKRAIEKAFHEFNGIPIKIGAQLYLKEFYSSFGFVQTSEQYLEDGIPHIEMLLKK